MVGPGLCNACNACNVCNVCNTLWKYSIGEMVVSGFFAPKLGSLSASGIFEKRDGLSKSSGC